MSIRLFDVEIVVTMRENFKPSQYHSNGHRAKEPEYRDLASDTLTVRADSIEQAAAKARRKAMKMHNCPRWTLNDSDMEWISREVGDSVDVQKVELVAETDID